MFSLVSNNKCRCTIFFAIFCFKNNEKKHFFCKGRKMWLTYNVEKPTLTTFCRNKEDKKLEHFFAELFGWNCYFLTLKNIYSIFFHFSFCLLASFLMLVDKGYFYFALFVILFFLFGNKSNTSIIRFSWNCYSLLYILHFFFTRKNVAKYGWTF